MLAIGLLLLFAGDAFGLFFNSPAIDGKPLLVLIGGCTGVYYVSTML